MSPLCSVLSVQWEKHLIPLVIKSDRRSDLKRRNDRTQASFRGSFSNRGNEAREVVDDEVGTNNDEGPPVPIPNTEVKLISGDDTWLATARENSTALTQRRQLQKCSCCFSLPRRQPSQRNGTEQKKRKLPQLKSNRRFGLKRRSDRAHAGFRRRAIPGDGSAAREIRDDASTALTQRRQTRFHGCRLSFIAFLLFSVFLSALFSDFSMPLSDNSFLSARRHACVCP